MNFFNLLNLFLFSGRFLAPVQYAIMLQLQLPNCMVLQRPCVAEGVDVSGRHIACICINRKVDVSAGIARGDHANVTDASGMGRAYSTRL
jgi:hypothetical protein